MSRSFEEFEKLLHAIAESEADRDPDAAALGNTLGAITICHHLIADESTHLKQLANSGVCVVTMEPSSDDPATQYTNGFESAARLRDANIIESSERIETYRSEITTRWTRVEPVARRVIDSAGRAGFGGVGVIVTAVDVARQIAMNPSQPIDLTPIFDAVHALKTIPKMIDFKQEPTIATTAPTALAKRGSKKSVKHRARLTAKETKALELYTLHNGNFSQMANDAGVATPTMRETYKRACKKARLMSSPSRSVRRGGNLIHDPADEKTRRGEGF